MFPIPGTATGSGNSEITKTIKVPVLMEPDIPAGRDQQINSKVYINKNVNIFSSGDKLNEEKEQG